MYIHMYIYMYIYIHVYYTYISYHVLNDVELSPSLSQPKNLAEASGESGIEDVLTQRGTSWDTTMPGRHLEWKLSTDFYLDETMV